jgi:hypothetical protein
MLGREENSLKNRQSYKNHKSQGGGGVNVTSNTNKQGDK